MPWLFPAHGRERNHFDIVDIRSYVVIKRKVVDLLLAVTEWVVGQQLANQTLIAMGTFYHFTWKKEGLT